MDSSLPYAGRIDIRNKSARTLAVRIPFWVRRKDLSSAQKDGQALQTEVNGIPVEVDWVGNRAIFQSLNPGDIISLNFPIVEQTHSYTANANSPHEQVYRLRLRGSTVVDISPRDESPTSYPLYLRDHLKPDPGQPPSPVPLRTVQRFTPNQIVRGW